MIYSMILPFMSTGMALSTPYVLAVYLNKLKTCVQGIRSIWCQQETQLHKVRDTIIIMTSSHGNGIRISGPLAGNGRIPFTNSQ